MATAVRGDLIPKGDLFQIPESVRQSMRERAMVDTYYLATQVLGYDMLTPNTHGPLTTFLDTCKSTRRMEQMPRSHFKTTIVTIAHRIKNIITNPGVRILIVGDTGPNAQKHLAKIKRHFDSNALFRWLFPELIWEDPTQAQAWNKEQIFVKSTAMHGEPTIDTVGARGAVVSRHFDIINADDLIGENEYYSETDMDRTIDWFSGLEALFVPPHRNSLMDIPSTFWRTNDVYAFAEKLFGNGQPALKTGPYSYQRGEIAVFRRGAREGGQPIFPEAITNEYLDRLQRENPERYAAQYANNPRASGVAYFREEYLKYYDVLNDEPDEWIGAVIGPNGERALIKPDNLFIVSMCDPAAGGKSKFRASKAAIITTGVSYSTGRIFILDLWLKRVPTDKIIDELFRQNDRWKPQIFSIEANGLQKMLKYWIDERTEKENLNPIPYVPFIPRDEKDSDRRIKGLQPLFRAGHIWLQRGTMQDLKEEYDVYPRGTKDGLDCLSQGLGFWNVGWDSVESESNVEDYEREIRRLRNQLTGY